ncbi:MAG: AAA family ATPase, partial [bacterium]
AALVLIYNEFPVLDSALCVLQAKSAVVRHASDGNERPLDVVRFERLVLVPLDRQLTMEDMMKSLALPIVLVARSGLGTINHTLLSIQALRQAGLTVMAVVLNQATPGRPGWIERDNRKTIQKMGGVPVLASLGFGMTLPRVARLLAPVAAQVLTGRETACRS